MNVKNETKTNQPKGIFIPFEVLQMDLKADEKIVLSIIAYYTEKGKSHACYLTNEQLSDLTGISYYLIRDRIKPALREKKLIASNGGIKNESLVNLYRETTTLENETPSSNDEGVSSNDDGYLYRETTMGGYREMTIQNKENKIKKNKEKINKSDYTKTYSNTCEDVDTFFNLDCGEVESFDTSAETNDTPSVENVTEPDDCLLNDDTPTPKQIAEAKRERVERISERFFQAVERHLKDKTTPSQNDIDKVSARLDEIGCKEARQLKRVMDDVLKEYFNGVCVYNPIQTETPSQVVAYIPTDRTRKAVSNDLPF